MILNLDGSPLRSGAKGNDFATLNDVQQHIVTVFGPLAQLLTEACDRIKALEDAAGIVAPDKNPSEKPHQTGVCRRCDRGWDFCACPEGPDVSAGIPTARTPSCIYCEKEPCRCPWTHAMADGGCEVVAGNDSGDVD